MRKKLLGAALPLSLLVTLFAAAPAYSTHGTANVTYEVNRLGTTVTGPITVQDVCNSTFCNFNLIFTTNRDYGQFVRWCGSTFDVTVPANTSNTSAFCFGPSQWRFAFGVALLTGGGTPQPTTHESPVTVRIIPFKP